MSSTAFGRDDIHLLKGIRRPGKHDVLFGRGGAINSHIGNIKFREIVDEQRPFYFAASKADKPLVALRVVQIMRKLEPPGRFLAPMKDSDKNCVAGDGIVWYDVGNKKARAKASQCLRERKIVESSPLRLSIHSGTKVEATKTGCPSSGLIPLRAPYASSMNWYSPNIVPGSWSHNGSLSDECPPIYDKDEYTGSSKLHSGENALDTLYYSPLPGSYSLHDHYTPTLTPGTATYLDRIVSTVSAGGEQPGRHVVQDTNYCCVDPLHFFESSPDNGAHRSPYMSFLWQDCSDQDKATSTHVLSPNSRHMVDPLLLSPSIPDSRYKYQQSHLWVPSFHSSESVHFDNNTFSVTTAPRLKGREMPISRRTANWPTQVPMSSTSSFKSETVSDLTDDSTTDTMAG